MPSRAVHANRGGGNADLEYDEDYGWAVEERISMDGIVLVDIHFILNHG